MNQGQIKYARNRAEAIYNTKYAELADKYTTEGHSLSNDEKLKALQAGKFTIADVGSSRGYGYSYNWYNYVTFDEEKLRTVDKEGLKTAQAALTKTYNDLVDELVLGDNEEALRLLTAFEAG